MFFFVLLPNLHVAGCQRFQPVLTLVRAGIYVSAGGLDPYEGVEVEIGDFLQIVYGIPQFDLEAYSSFEFPQLGDFSSTIPGETHTQRSFANHWFGERGPSGRTRRNDLRGCPVGYSLRLRVANESGDSFSRSRNLLVIQLVFCVALE